MGKRENKSEFTFLDGRFKANETAEKISVRPIGDFCFGSFSCFKVLEILEFIKGIKIWFKILEFTFPGSWS